MLPAYAGMIRHLGVADVEERRAPRVCGDDPLNAAQGSGFEGCSPRMRG